MTGEGDRASKLCSRALLACQCGLQTDCPGALPRIRFRMGFAPSKAMSLMVGWGRQKLADDFFPGRGPR